MRAAPSKNKIHLGSTEKLPFFDRLRQAGAVAPIAPFQMLSLRRASSRWWPASRLLSTSPADLAAENARLRAELSALRDAAAANRAGGAAGAAAAAAAERTLFVGARSSYTSELRFWCPEEGPPPSPMPCFRLVDDLGEVVPGAEAHTSTRRPSSGLRAALFHTCAAVNRLTSRSWTRRSASA